MDVGSAIVLLVSVAVLARNVVDRAKAPQSPKEEEQRILKSSFVDSIEVVSRDRGGGNQHTVRWAPSSGTLLMLYRSDCPACIATKPTWQSLVDSLPSIRVVAIAAGVDTTMFSLDRDRIEMLRTAWGVALRDVFESSYVPTTVLVGAHGKVRWVRIGVLNQTDVGELLVAGKELGRD